MSKFSFDWSALKEGMVQEEATKKKGFQKDERFFKLSANEKGEATAIIRFLPDNLPSKGGKPYIKYYTHNFKYMIDGVTKYWIRNCINTHGYDQKCPICTKNMEYYNSAFQSDKDIAGQRKRKLVYVSNVLVVKNPANPELEGKVMLFSYGIKIFEKINDKMFPSEKIKELGEYDEYVPFDLVEGANLRLVQVLQGATATQKGFPNYDNSEFGKQCSVGTDAKIEEIMKQVVDLSEFVAEDKFPTNDEVIQKLGSLLGLTTPEPTKEKLLTENNTLEDISTDSIVDDDIPDFTPPSSSDGEDPDEDFFKNL